MKTALRPRNFSRASAYPARETRKTRPTVTSNVTITEFVNHSGKSVWASRSNAAVVIGSGTRASGFATASPLVLNDVETCTMNG